MPSQISFPEFYPYDTEIQDPVLFERIRNQAVPGSEEQLDHAAVMSDLTALPAAAFRDAMMPGDLSQRYRSHEAGAQRIDDMERSQRRGYAAAYIIRLRGLKGNLEPVGVASFMYPDPKGLRDKVKASLNPAALPNRDFAGWIRADRVAEPASAAELAMIGVVNLAERSGIGQLSVSVAEEILVEPIRGHNRLAVVEAFAPNVGFTAIGSVVQHTEDREYPGQGFVLRTNA